jgi:hypothetical protein
MGEEERDKSRDDTEVEQSRDTEVEQESGEPAAPSIGAKTQIEHVPPEERLAGHDHDTEDAMGRDKRRQVKGESYGPSRTRVIVSFLVFFAIVGVIFIGLLFAVDRLDRPPDTVQAKAPWAAEGAETHEPAPIDARPDGAEGELGEQQVESGSAGADQ